MTFDDRASHVTAARFRAIRPHWDRLNHLERLASRLYEATHGRTVDHDEGHAAFARFVAVAAESARACMDADGDAAERAAIHDTDPLPRSRFARF